jgi:putative restriction endonuclease
VFGEINGVVEGTVFANRKAASERGVHRPLVAGIAGIADEGAESICVAGGYPDDEDYWSEIIYTGQGGNDTTKAVRQVRDQVLEAGNRALATSADRGLPVRVLRGSGGDPTYSPLQGYRYDGLYYVDRYWSEVGRSGFVVWRFRLVRIGEAAVAPSVDSDEPATRISGTVQRLVRNTSVTQAVKELHKSLCQICGVNVETVAGPYAEGCHIKPLGRPHDGPDAPGNVLCLCPNDHVRFDRGWFVLSDDLEIVESATGRPSGRLRLVKHHMINLSCVQYHRGLFSSASESPSSTPRESSLRTPKKQGTQ